MKPLRISLRVVFYKEEGHWIAHCLEFNLIGHGKTKRGALKMLSQAITIQFAQSVKHNNPKNLFSPADGKFFAMFAAGKDVAIGKMRVRVELAEDGVTMDKEIQAREYLDSDAELAFA